MSAPSYQAHDPKGWCGDPKRGAAMGRHAYRNLPASAEVRLYLRRVYLDMGGYDVNGTYWGSGAPLYWYASSDGKIDVVTRATDRDDAKRLVRLHYPRASFWR